jgi:hypothetical protein
MDMDTNDPFDRWLETELRTELGLDSSTNALPQPLYRSERRRRLRFAGLVSIPLALSLRAVTALAVAGMAAGGGAAIAVNSHPAGHPNPASTSVISLSAASKSPSASTHKSPSASNHGSVVTSAVASCKAARPSADSSPKPSPGSRGIGQCVSVVASNGRAGGADSSGSGGATGHPTPPPHPTPPNHPTPPPHP